MSLTANQKIAHYQIVAPIGAGGMGEVYRARDTKLDRDVAIKVLPEAFAKDDERLRRFEREAKLLASLNHPNIASIYGLEESDGVKALVLELVEGPTLAERIGRGPIPVDETIAIARQIAEALEAGHDAGVIHRDLKPANVKLKEDGTVKVLDYGLAKALEGGAPRGEDSELSQSPTLTRQGTQVGTILGTAAYMSPEQAKGKRVDKRADVWAFGAVVYEMLTGERAFAGQDVSDTLAAVLRAEPDFEALPAGTPHAVRQALRLCLTKDLKARVRAIGDVALAIDGAFASAPAERESARPSGIVGVAGFLLGAIAAGVLAWSLLRPNPPQVMRFTTEVDQLASTAGEGAKITPDGKMLVYVGEVDGERQVFRRSLDEADATAIAGTEGTQQIVVSPDAQWVGFHSSGLFKKVPLGGGTAVTIMKNTGARGFSWGDDGTIVYGTASGGLWRVPDTGGEPERLTEAAPGRNHNRPYHLPDAKGLLFNDWSLDDSRIAVLPAGAREPRTLLEGVAPRLAPTGHLLFKREGSLWAVPFDLNRLDVDGAPVPVIEGIHASGAGAKRYDVARDGTLIYVPGVPEPTGGGRIDWIDRDGVVTTVVEQVSANAARVAPDGNRVVVRFSRLGGLWVFDIERRSRSLVSPIRTDHVVWSPDGTRIAYLGHADAIVRAVSANASGDEEILFESQGRGLRPRSWSPDGRTLALDNFGDTDIWILPIGGEPERFIATAANERQPRFSPDGRYLAYVSDESGRNEVQVQSYPDLGDKWTVSTDGGMFPVWARDGRELFYRSQGHLMAVEVRTEPSFSAGTSRVLLDAQQLAAYTEPFDVSPDGQRFLFVEDVSLSQKRSLVVILNWTEELKRLVPTR